MTHDSDSARCTAVPGDLGARGCYTVPAVNNKPEQDLCRFQFQPQSSATLKPQLHALWLETTGDHFVTKEPTSR